MVAVPSTLLSAMRLTSVYRFMFVSLLPLAASIAAETGSRAFVERVKPEDFYATEMALPEKFSYGHDLVIMRTTAGQAVSVIALQKATAGDGYTLTLHFASTNVADGWLKISEDIEANLGRQVLRAVELKLHRQVMLSKFKRTPSKTDSDLWLYQKLSDGRVAAAVIAMEDTFENPDATVFIDDFLGGLQQLIGKEGAERSALLQTIDRIATDIILVGPR